MSDELRDLYARAGGGDDPLRDEPDWKVIPHLRNWHTHLPERIKRLWPDLDTEARMVAFLVADEQCWRDDWR